ncbi:MAG: tRNA uridine(34) 5-carboxymethylaminomethyl modification radical SAM/GNAT enzyme Elp3 [Chloroflexi bacterium]|nr:tRNA uridine(34) 5-carboxymethylaminomethyl modification radical SAM/GNAT enzyme Elp3 [Chloroflexota bacterium]
MNDREFRSPWRFLSASLDIETHRAQLLALFDAVRSADRFSARTLNALAIKHIRVDGQAVPQAAIIKAYETMVAAGDLPADARLAARLRLKPTRTISGVAPVAVLTGPYPCPADCIFCPEAKGYPRSYLPDEPAVQRAKRARFDPFRETQARVQALDNMGHPTDKIELLIVGATWSAYPHRYQDWFVQRCLEALNGQPAASLAEAQTANEKAAHRCVGMVVETRPDWITLDEVRRLRRLGVTKVQIGIQSTDDRILALNRRGHDHETTRRALRMLRLGGFKLHVHWMPNLLGATPESDRADFRRLWDDPAIRPDEMKIYPCSLIAGTELHRIWERGEFRPYSDDELIELLVDCKQIVPGYCRLNRVVRDIPKQYVVAGSTQSNLRDVVKRIMQTRGVRCQCIRCREVRGEPVDTAALRAETTTYETDATTEHFLSYVTPAGRLAGFLRLSLPRADAPPDELLEEVRGSAMVREVHVYGPALELGTESHGEAQHTGLGRRLAERATDVARAAGYKRIAVIAAIGTREYYRKLGFERGELYMSRAL